MIDANICSSVDVFANIASMIATRLGAIGFIIRKIILNMKLTKEDCLRAHTQKTETLPILVSSLKWGNLLNALNEMIILD